MGFTQQAVVGTLKRQYSNENNTHSSAATHCVVCEKGLCDDDCSKMKAHLQKRFREISPSTQRKPLGTMDMLHDCQHLAMKTEVLGITQHRKVDTLDLATLAQVVDNAGAGSDSSTGSEISSSVQNSTSNEFELTSRPETNQTAVPLEVSSVVKLPTLQRVTESNTSNSINGFTNLRISETENNVPNTITNLLRNCECECRNRKKIAAAEGTSSTSSSSDYSEIDESSSIETETDDDIIENAGGDKTTRTPVKEDDQCSNETILNSGDAKRYLGVRPSMFDFVPPFINFCQHSEQCGCLPPEVRNLLKWRLSTITPTVVRETVRSSGFRLLKKTVDWTGQWGKHMKAIMFRASLKDYQKINHLPATFQVGRKDKLWRNYQRHRSKFGKENFDFLPKSYILPQEMKSFKIAWEASPRGRPWIIKPPAGARGNGIRVINKWGQVPKKRATIAQKYVCKPFLINSRKFDIRLYVLVTSFHPMKIYIYRDGLVRFASVKYTSASKRVSDRFMHLTNYSINKYCDLYANNADPESTEGHKWTLKSLWRFLKNEGHDVDDLWCKLEDITIKTFICAEDQLTASAFNLPSRYNGYELFGLDIILDENLRPWLLEVNISPSLHSSSPVDTAVKAPLIREVFNIVGYHFPDSLPKLLQRKLISAAGKAELETAVFDKRLYTNALSSDEKAKQSAVKTNFEDRDKYIKEALLNLTPDDLRYLIQAEDELSQCSGFKRIFPSPSSHEYLQFLDAPRYYNLLFDAWEHEYGCCREVGIKYLRHQCNLKLHLHGTKDICVTSMANDSPSPQTEDKIKSGSDSPVADGIQ